MQHPRTSAHLVFKVSRGHGDAALHLIEALAWLFGQIEASDRAADPARK